MTPLTARGYHRLFGLRERRTPARLCEHGPRIEQRSIDVDGMQQV